MHQLRTKAQCRGFTLVELVVVIVLIAIVAAIAVPRIANPQQMAAPGERQLLISTFSQTQQLARNQQCAYAMDLTGSGWQVKRASDCTQASACWQDVENLTNARPTATTNTRYVFWQQAWYSATITACTDLTTLANVVSPSASIVLSDGSFRLHGWTGYAE